MKSGTLFVNRKLFKTLIAISDQEQLNGLMNIDPPTPIMSFIYNYPRINKFWMANTKAPLDIVFCYQGKISQIHNGEPFSNRMIGDNNHSDLVVEFPYGTITSNKIKIGDSIGLLNPTLNELKKF